ncbi:MAG: AAA family ATPase, partial [Firmicutes bacterium]|nr:AAA family ATPase [Bacillota bacterium]
MKNLVFINGTMGVGKTATSRELQNLLPDCVFLDGDWCWDMSPFTVTEETKAMVEDNICHMLNNFLKCSEFDNIIFCWVMHQQVIMDNLLSRLDTHDTKVFRFSLTCSDAA